jgi:hypothetical protein
VRLHFIVEGQTEETFVNRVITPHLATYSIWGDARCVMTSRKHRKIYRGGIFSYTMVKKDIILWMKEDKNSDVAFTTMFDLYALPSDFPGYDEARKLKSVYDRIAILEEAMYRDISLPNFIPYFQLHEFEALLLADPQQLDWEYFEHDKAIRNLIRIVSSFDSPELINDGSTTSPSKRIIHEIPEYEGMKASVGPLVAEKIGLGNLRKKCQHFNEWLLKLEQWNAPN